MHKQPGIDALVNEDVSEFRNVNRSPRCLVVVRPYERRLSRRSMHNAIYNQQLLVLAQHSFERIDPI
jgi:hypothetical protein